MARIVSPAPPPAALMAPEPEDMALLALLALSNNGFDLDDLGVGAKRLLPALGLQPPDAPSVLLTRLQRLQAHKLLTLERWGAARCEAKSRDAALLHAWRQGWSAAVGQAYRDLRGHSDLRRYPSVASFRVALASEAFAELLDLVDCFDLPRTSPLAVLEELAEAVPQPLDAAWLNHLPAEVGHLLAWALLNRAVLRWEPLEPLAQWLENLPEPDSDYLLLLVETLLYQGRFPEAEAAVRLLNPGPEPVWPAHLLGLACLLQGRREQALAAFDQAYTALQAANKRKRTPLLPGPVGWFHALTLVQCGQGEQAERLAKVYGGRAFQDRHSGVWDGLLDLAVLAQGRKLPKRPLLPARLEDAPAQYFMHIHGAYWADPDGFQSESLDGFLAKLGKLADRGGLPWFQAQVRVLTERHQGLPAADASRLADCLAATPPWQRTLDSLARLGQEPLLAKSPKAAKPRRLGWALRVYRGAGGYEDWSLEARDQRQDKGGSWGPGRGIPLHKLRSASVGMDFLGPQDRLGIEATTDRPYASREDIWRILYALAGHDALFLEAQGELKPLQVRQGEPQLRVQTQGGGLRLQLFPDCAEGSHVVVEDGPDRLTVYAFSPRHREVSALLGAKGLQVPAQGQEQVAKAVASVASLLAVHSDLPLGGLGAGLEEVAADPTPELDLRPWGEGLRIQLRVRPVSGGPGFSPGSGAAELILEANGRRCRTQRDLALEQRRAAAVVQACAELKGRGWDWDLEEPGDCLGLLLALEPLRAQVRLAWPEGERFQAPVRATAKGLRLGLKGEGQWFALEGGLQLDEGRVVALQDLLAALSEAKGDFVPLGQGQWLSLERVFRERLEGLRALAVPHGSGLRLAPAAALALEDLTAEVGRFTAPKAWKDRASAIRQAFTQAVAVPVTLQATLRPYQEDGFQWLARLAEAGLGACLADDMGLGKTVQALALLLRRAARGPALVLAPTSVVGNWLVEARRFAPTLEVRVFGEGDRAQLLESAGPFTLVLCSYGLLVQEQESLTGKAWATVILDEAQAIKNADTQRSKAVMALQAEARVAMSGTPVENHLGELWNLSRFLNPGLLGSAEHFTRTFATPIARDQDRASLQQLKRILQPFLLRRTKHEVLQELPAMTEIVHEVVLSDAERSFYEALRRRALDKLAAEGPAKGGQGQLQILAELMRLRRACCHPRLVEPGLALPSAKLEAFADIVAELRENRHRALVFSQFVDHLTVLREYLDGEGISYQYLDGGTPAGERRKRIDAFQQGAGDLFLISLKAGGTGLNLTAADYVIHMDPWWNPAVEDQASARAHRLGQERPVTVYRLVAQGTIETKILELHHAKRHLADGILEGAGAAAALSAEDLMALLR